MQNPNQFVRTVHGFDPYNTVDAHFHTRISAWRYCGPLNPVAYRDQRAWDFLPGHSADAKMLARNMEIHGNGPDAPGS